MLTSDQTVKTTYAIACPAMLAVAMTGAVMGDSLSSTCGNIRREEQPTTERVRAREGAGLLHQVLHMLVVEAHEAPDLVGCLFPGAANLGHFAQVRWI